MVKSKAAYIIVIIQPAKIRVGKGKTLPVPLKFGYKSGRNGKKYGYKCIQFIEQIVVDF